MPGGSLEPDDSAREQQCKHCGLWFALTGIHNHRKNCLLKDVDATVQPAEGGSDHDLAAGADDAPDTPADAPETTPEVAPDTSPDTADARTDGGLEPPTPSSSASDPTDDTDEVPEHFGDVDEWIDEVERVNPRLAETEEWARICAEAENYEYVNLEETDLETGSVVFE